MSCHDIGLDQTMPNVELQAISIYYNMSRLIDQIIYCVHSHTSEQTHRQADRRILVHYYILLFINGATINMCRGNNNGRDFFIYPPYTLQAEEPN